MDRDVLVTNKYETAMATAHQFLSVFLKKCSNKSEDIDYRPVATVVWKLSAGPPHDRQHTAVAGGLQLSHQGQTILYLQVG